MSSILRCTSLLRTCAAKRKPEKRYYAWFNFASLHTSRLLQHRFRMGREYCANPAQNSDQARTAIANSIIGTGYSLNDKQDCDPRASGILVPQSKVGVKVCRSLCRQHTTLVCSLPTVRFSCLGKFFCVSFVLGLTVSIYTLIVGIYYLQAKPYPISIRWPPNPPQRYGGLAPCRDGTGHARDH